LAVFYVRHSYCIPLPKSTVMRVLFPLVALLAGAHALSSSPYQKRAGSDTCANIEATVEFPNPLNGKPITFGSISICACLSGIPNLCNTNPVLLAASLVVGTPKVVNFVTILVTTGPGSHICTYPDHASPVCSSGNPCDFTCSDGFTRSDGKCVCNPPFKECSGKCELQPACPSKSPHKRDANEWKKRVMCDGGYTACGVLGHSKLAHEAYECVDARNDLESCGGCSIPLHRGSPQGVDCTSLIGAADVSCMDGSCYVQKCTPGYQLAVDSSMCLDDETVKKFTTIGEYGWGQFVPMGFE